MTIVKQWSFHASLSFGINDRDTEIVIICCRGHVFYVLGSVISLPPHRAQHGSLFRNGHRHRSSRISGEMMLQRNHKWLPSSQQWLYPPPVFLVKLFICLLFWQSLCSDHGLVEIFSGSFAG